MSNRLEQIINLKLNKFEIKYPKKKESYIEPNPCGEPGYVAYGTKIKDGVEVPNCIPDPEEMKKVIKEGFPIPSPSSDESESDYMSRCISEISGEYEHDQSIAICIGKWQEK
jgi:hypothetical protein